MAKVCNCGMILVSHVNKRAQGENANNAATGSTDFINAARSAIRVIFNDEPGMKDTRIMVHTKSNYAEPGKSVVYQILKNSGCNWAGFSEITRKTLEDAARWRKTPHEVIRQLATQAETNSALIEAITEKAIPGKTVNISYDEMRLEYGEDIFGSGQPKKALAIVTADLKEIGITIQTGKTVKYDGKTRNGFGIFQSDGNARVKDEPEEADIL